MGYGDSMALQSTPFHLALHDSIWTGRTAYHLLQKKGVKVPILKNGNINSVKNCSRILKQRTQEILALGPYYVVFCLYWSVLRLLYSISTRITSHLLYITQASWREELSSIRQWWWCLSSAWTWARVILNWPIASITYQPASGASMCTIDTSWPWWRVPKITYTQGKESFHKRESIDLFLFLPLIRRNTSGLPFFDVLLLENLPKSASLPVATVQQTKERIRTGVWTFDYIFFTESDQVLISLKVHPLLHALPFSSPAGSYDPIPRSTVRLLKR
jgi:hypothetical protein